jgi:hypothetical protein
MTAERKVAVYYSQDELDAAAFHHPAWTQAAPIPITHKWSGEVAPDSRHAEARIVWSADALSVRFVCRQAEPLIINPDPQLHKKSIGLWERDVCEIFIAPDPKHPEHYFEFEVAPTGEWLDLGIRVTASGRETDWEFQSGMKAGQLLERDRILLMMTIPWSAAIPKPLAGHVWRVNLFRCVGLGNERYLAWQPTCTPEPYFHVPGVFGELEFIQSG